MNKKEMRNLKKFAVSYDLIRGDGRLEKVCSHGIGHTVGHINPSLLGDRYIWIHGCDGCCTEYKRMASRP